MDRLRLLPRGTESSWLDASTRDDLIAWIGPRRNWLVENFSMEMA